MPYYKWTGVNMRGAVLKGKMCAPSITILDQMLFGNNIALLNAQKISIPFWSYYISLDDLISLYVQLENFISAGILLPKAIHLCSRQANSVYIQEVLIQIWLGLEQGESLSTVACRYPVVVPPIIRNLLIVGEESGSLRAVLQVIINYMTSKRTFSKKVQAAFLMPTIMGIFLLLVVILVVFFIIPQFQSLFASLGASLPLSTRLLILMSSYVGRYSGFVVACVILLSISTVLLYTVNHAFRTYFDRFFLSIPIIGRLVKYRAQAHWFLSLSLMLDGGMTLVDALTIAGQGVENRVLKKIYMEIANLVAQGDSLTDAMGYYGEGGLFEEDVIAIVHTGQETGKLPPLLWTAAELLTKKLDAALSLVGSLLQPCLLVVLGSIVLAVIIALYEPILSMSQSIAH